MIKPFVWRSLIFSLAIFGLAACEHEYPLAWSPDGSTMAVAAEDGLRLGDAQGTLSAPIAGSDTAGLAWLPDSKRLIVAGHLQAKTWAEAQKYLSEQQQQDTIALAKYIKERLQTAGESALNDDLRLKSAPAWMTQGAALYLVGTDRDALKTITSAETFKSINNVSLDVKNVRLHTVKPVVLPDSKELWRGFENVENIQVAPDGRYALLVVDESSDSKMYDVDLVPLDVPSPPVKLVETRTPGIAWSADSRAIILTSAAGTTEDAKIGSLTLLPIRDANGIPLPTPAAAERLMRLCLDPAPHVRVLKNGKILFTTSTVQLPATDHDIGARQEIFSFTQGDKLVRRLMPVQDAETMWSIDSMQISPDQTVASIACKVFGNDILNLLNTATGNVEQLSFIPKFQPCWRTGDEICFTKKLDKPGANQHTAEVVLHSVSKNEDRIMSAGWPKSAVDGFLMESTKK